MENLQVIIFQFIHVCKYYVFICIHINDKLLFDDIFIKYIK